MVDTIVALASPMGVGGVGVMRLSGPQALTMADRLLKKPLRQSRYMYHRIIYHPDESKIDEGCVVFFRAPHSFTGEDVVEFHIHSGIQVIQQLRAALYYLGAREAVPGEFTKRAFMNGKIDLTKAEGIIDLIEAPTQTAHGVALAHVNGALYTWITTIRTALQRVLEQVEGSIDFPDEVPGIDRDGVYHQLQALMNSVQDCLKKQDFGEFIYRCVRCVMVGQPNVGKSTLFNTLLGDDRAIVTSVPGTTRDYLTATVSLGGLQFEFIDSAGVRTPSTMVERLGIRKLWPLLHNADLIFWVQDRSKTITAVDHQVMQRLKKTKKPVWQIINKADLKTTRRRKEYGPEHWRTYEISAKTSLGIPTLKEQLAATFSLPAQTDLALMCNARQKACLDQLSNQLQSLIKTVQNAFEDDLLAFDLKAAIQSCSELTGQAVTESVLEGIFSRFCVGK